MTMEAEFSLDAGLSELERIAKVMESGQESLENSIELLKKATVLHAKCKARLEELKMVVVKVEREGTA
jgi:exodeoxyribonuclease VII small subunit